MSTTEQIDTKCSLFKMDSGKPLTFSLSRTIPDVQRQKLIKDIEDYGGEVSDHVNSIFLDVVENADKRSKAQARFDYRYVEECVNTKEVLARDEFFFDPEFTDNTDDEDEEIVNILHYTSPGNENEPPESNSGDNRREENIEVKQVTKVTETFTPHKGAPKDLTNRPSLISSSKKRKLPDSYNLRDDELENSNELENSRASEKCNAISETKTISEQVHDKIQPVFINPSLDGRVPYLIAEEANILGDDINKLNIQSAILDKVVTSISNKYSVGYDIVLGLLHRTSTDTILTEQILFELKNSDQSTEKKLKLILNNVKGLFTKADDDMLFSENEASYEYLQSKHGRELVELRKQYWSKFNGIYEKLNVLYSEYLH
ncbi:hypothetical protein V1511DRAFT_489086 [Dipodascopsis uninucleata]